MSKKADLSGNFGPDERYQPPKLHGKVQKVQQRIDKLKEAKALIVKMARSVGPNGKYGQIGMFENALRKTGTWCRTNGFPNSADAISNFLNVTEDYGSLQKNLAKVIVAFNIDLQNAKRIFGAKRIPVDRVKAAKLPRVTVVHQIKGEVDRIFRDVGPKMNVEFFHRWNGILKNAIKRAKSIGEDELAGLLETMMRSNNISVLNSTAAQLKLKLAALQ